MKVIVASDHNVLGNIVRGAFQQSKLGDVEVVDVTKLDQMAGAVAEESVVLVDWELADDMGVAFVRAAKKARAAIPVILLCPKPKQGTVYAGVKAGASAVVNKPFDPEELFKAVARSVKRNAGEKDGKKAASVNVEFINPFIDATRNVFTTMCGMTIERKNLFLKDDYKMFGDVSGVMGLSGTASGTVVVSFPETLACKVVSQMLGEAPAEGLNEDVCDGVGEIINMIAGQAKASLVKTKYHFVLSIPAVVSGAGHEITHRKGTPNIVVVFEAEGQDFAIQVCLAPCDNGD